MMPHPSESSNADRNCEANARQERQMDQQSLLLRKNGPIINVSIKVNVTSAFLSQWQGRDIEKFYNHPQWPSPGPVDSSGPRYYPYPPPPISQDWNNGWNFDYQQIGNQNMMPYSYFPSNNFENRNFNQEFDDRDFRREFNQLQMIEPTHLQLADEEEPELVENSKNLIKKLSDKSPQSEDMASMKTLEEQRQSKIIINKNLEIDFRKLEALFYHYFYNSEGEIPQFVYTKDEMSVIRIFLQKKLIHDKNESKIYFRIRSLQEKDLRVFLNHQKPINRKNVIKMNIFVKIWKHLENLRGADFYTFYFHEFTENDLCDVLNKKHRLISSQKLTDQIYSRAFMSLSFREDFFNTLQNPKFKEITLEQSKVRFLNNFKFWVGKISNYLVHTDSRSKAKNKIPEVKFGLSAADYDESLRLFRKLIRHARNLI
jgi:hypothetical protein